MGWFNFIESEGLFKPEHNPEPIKVKEGYQMPHWSALDFLEKLSLQIKEGKETELTDELLRIIIEISGKPKDNYITWYRIIKILCNLPNEKITNEILGFMPVWFSGRFDTMLQTSEVCEHLLPKFLNDNPTIEDIQKAESILIHLFSIERKIEPDLTWGTITTNYVSRVYLYYLHQLFEDTDFLRKLAKFSSKKFILSIAERVKELLFDYPKSIIEDVDYNETKYEINLIIDGDTITVKSSIAGNNNDIKSSVIEKYEDLNEDQLASRVVALLQEQGINYIQKDNSSNIIRRLLFITNVDASSGFGYDPISKLGDTKYNDNTPLNVFAFAFRNLLNEKVKQSEDGGLELLQIFVHDKAYRLSFFKRTVLYAIGENWEKTHSLFMDLINERDPFLFFSRYRYRQELYELLNKNQEALSDEDKNMLQAIIELGKQDENNGESDRELDDWKLYWYSALRNISPFAEKYQELSERLKRTYEHYENLGKVTFRKGHISPVTKQELLQQSNKGIVEFLLSFKPTNKAFDEPSVNGLADTLHDAVATEPQFFLDEIHLYKNVPYLYAYQMALAFGEALKNNIDLNWRQLIHFFSIYVDDEQFLSGKLGLANDSWKADAEWVSGAVANLLGYGMNDDRSAIDFSLLPLIKKIILSLAKYAPNESPREKQPDYVNYTLNSTTGKILRSMLDYSLFRARNYVNSEYPEKWEVDVRTVFSDTLNKKSLDAYVLLGWYFEHFYYLDKEWAIRQVNDLIGKDDREWKAFMGGFLFSAPPHSKELYELFNRHYDRMLDQSINTISSSQLAFINHFTAFYFWGFEQLSDNRLVYKFVEKEDANRVGSLVDFIIRQEDYYKSLEVKEKTHFEGIIYELWRFLVNKYQKADDEQQRTILSNLAGLLVYTSILTEENTELLVVSLKYLPYRFGVSELLRNISSIKNNGNQAKVSALIARILSEIDFNYFISDDDQQIIIELVSFLFENGQHQVASSICNTFAANQLFFLREVYESYRRYENK